ncbi:MAG TPA: FtsX-like permease family protein, partial [Acetobacteraceae bacterium]|nr:FtsX-like permease family protein [Acetobacteraceae bacterium]
GIRMALGARRADVWRTVIRESLQPAAIGLGAGAIGAWALESVVRSSVFGWPASGWLSLAIVAAGLFSVATVAALIPAARATRIDPAVTLKSE